MSKAEDDLNAILGMAAAEAPQVPPDEKLMQVSNAAHELVMVRRRIQTGEDLLAELRTEEQRLSTEVIPSLLDEIGLSAIKMSDGSSVSCKPFYSGKIIPEAEPLAFQWLEENGHGGVIKGEATFEYRRAERDRMLHVLSEIRSTYGLEAKTKLGVHHSTLRALFKEVIESGGSFPPDLFSLFMGRQTTIK